MFDIDRFLRICLLKIKTLLKKIFQFIFCNLICFRMSFVKWLRMESPNFLLQTQTERLWGRYYFLKAFTLYFRLSVVNLMLNKLFFHINSGRNKNLIICSYLAACRGPETRKANFSSKLWWSKFQRRHVGVSEEIRISMPRFKIWCKPKKPKQKLGFGQGWRYPRMMWISKVILQNRQEPWSCSMIFLAQEWLL